MSTRSPAATQVSVRWATVWISSSYPRRSRLRVRVRLRLRVRVRTYLVVVLPRSGPLPDVLVPGPSLVLWLHRRVLLVLILSI